MTYGIGVVGVGVWGCHSLEQTLCKAGDARIVAVSTEDRWGARNYAQPCPQRGREYAQQLGAEYCEDWRGVVRRADVQIVSVMVCPREKAEVIIAALQAGKHVVTDKPLTFTPDEARAVCEAERASPGRGFMLAGRHTQPLVRRLVEELKRGRVGEIKAISIRLCFMGGVFPGFEPSTRWRSEVPSGELTTIGSHALVTLFKLMDEPVRDVYALLRNNFYTSYRMAGAEDWAQLNLGFASGAVANITVARLPHRIANEDALIEVTGTEGYAQIAGERLSFWPDGETVTPPAPPSNPLVETFQAFYHAIDTGAPPPTTFADGLRLQNLLDAALRSAESGAVVRV